MYQDIIKNKLSAQINYTSLEIINESHLHAGHNGFSGEGESHFRIKISAPEFNQLSRIAIHRKINKILKEELKDIHALAIEIS